jgi:hypothetical protein
MKFCTNWLFITILNLLASNVLAQNDPLSIDFVNPSEFTTETVKNLRTEIKEFIEVSDMGVYAMTTLTEFPEYDLCVEKNRSLFIKAVKQSLIVKSLLSLLIESKHPLWNKYLIELDNNLQQVNQNLTALARVLRKATSLRSWRQLDNHCISKGYD